MSLLIYFIYLVLAALGVRFYTWAFSSRGERGLFSSCDVWASHCSGFSCYRAQAVRHGVQLLWSMGLAAPRHMEYFLNQ